MPSPVPVVTIFGGSGFVGRYVAQNMARAGWRVRVAVRRPDLAGFVRPYGDVGQVEPLLTNVRDEDSTRRAISGADAVINCVGILAAIGKQQFDTVVAEAAGRIARISAEEGVGKLVQISAIGADADSAAEYGRAKAEAERLIGEHFPGAVILRPSIIFGVEDEFFNRFAGMARLAPVLPLVGAETRFQPVYVADVAQAASKSVLEDVEPGVYELGGPEVATFRDLMERMLDIIDRPRPILALPGGLARALASVLDFVQRISFGIIPNAMITRDQVRMLGRDNVVAEDARGFAALGIKPTAMEAVLEDYLYAYRPNGQYDEMIDSALRARN